jgi:lipoate-protein ligase A
MWPTVPPDRSFTIPQPDFLSADARDRYNSRMVPLRLLPFQSAVGPTLMAQDEALLHSATAGIATLRFYAWNEPTLSLGYFQSAALRKNVPHLDELPWVRRATGGAALVHHHELTYALALPPGSPWHDPHPLPWTCRFHQILAEVLHKGWNLTVKRVNCGEERKLGEVLCFLDQTRGDLLADGHKIAGSAQRKQRGAILQHGGILLRQSRYTPELPGIAELLGLDLAPQELADEMTQAIAQEINASIVPDNWTDHERATAEAIAQERYRNPEWNNKR